MNKVLVVDDERSIRITLGEFLKADGFDVTVASDYQDAVGLIEQDHFDLIISDIVLSGHSGVDLLQFAKGRRPDLPFILITGNPTIETATKGAESGAFAYIEKPLLKHDLLSLAHKVLSHGVVQEDGRKRDAGLPQRTTEINLEDIEKVQVRLPNMSGNGASVLFIDDEPTVLNSTIPLLRHLKYQAKGVPSLKEALDYLLTHTIQVAILDLNMPGSSAVNAFQSIKNAAPNAKIILTSGYGLSLEAKNILNLGAYAMLPKPFTLSELEELLAQALKPVGH